MLVVLVGGGLQSHKCGDSGKMMEISPKWNQTKHYTTGPAVTNSNYENTSVT